MADINRHTGEPISGWAEVAQSLDVILTTHIGERVRRLSFGVDEFALQDRPMNSAEIADAFVEIATAIEPRLVNGQQYGEPRFDLVRIVPFRAGSDGVVGFELRGLYYPLALSGNFAVFESASFSIPGE